MSDLQIVTGFSIMISGFAQLNCGLTTFEWQMIIHLAWFSSISSFLPNIAAESPLSPHNRAHLAALCQAILAGLLCMGILFTGNYGWNSAGLGANILWTTSISVIMITFAFISRVIKLHRKLSVGAFKRARGWLSDRSQRILNKLYGVWLILSFSWGISRAFLTIEVPKEMGLFVGFENDASDWTFGQVVALVLLVAPFLIIF
ncbi:hypothetical protein N7532_003218 [Penicillium argentinense]|uniref:Uncharacterized protein n=1 Tax=Penicillium argentinense TaxID=1131581 RepID=A0A9W9KDT2_9EURO|nr:uncharacterized protein N7532_003218 [Penicillium argentinense]KAJ5102689.1 hypothetical protein N7532_003218 [Penicillium argentinense]